MSSVSTVLSTQAVVPRAYRSEDSDRLLFSNDPVAYSRLAFDPLCDDVKAVEKVCGFSLADMKKMCTNAKKMSQNQQKAAGAIVIAFASYSNLIERKPVASKLGHALAWYPREKLETWAPFQSFKWALDIVPSAPLLFFYAYHIGIQTDDTEGRLCTFDEQRVLSLYTHCPACVSHGAVGAAAGAAAPHPGAAGGVTAPHPAEAASGTAAPYPGSAVAAGCGAAAPTAAPPAATPVWKLNTLVPLRACSACKWVAYCNRDHQTQHYQTHKKTCPHYKRVLQADKNPLFC